MLQKVAIGLGSNLGDREEYLVRAYEALQHLLRYPQVSDVYETPPVGRYVQPAYLNAVVTGFTEQPPRDLLRTLKQLELTLGRTQLRTGRPREIDLDILLYGEQIVALGEHVLLVPHPRLHERWFAMTPLVQIWPRAWHPIRQQRISALVEKIPKPRWVGRYAIDWRRAS